MAIDDLPLPVVNLLNVIGVPWPYIDEDTLREFASFTREFATAVQTTHDDATRTVRNIAAAYQGSATDAMNSGWAKLSARHVDEVLTACHVLADALDVAAVYVVGQKVEAIAILVDMAAAFIADQAAAIATAGIAEAAVPLIIAGAEKLVDSLAADLEQYIIGMVIEAAAKPLLAKIEGALAGLDWTGRSRVRRSTSRMASRSILRRWRCRSRCCVSRPPRSGNTARPSPPRSGRWTSDAQRQDRSRRQGRRRRRGQRHGGRHRGHREADERGRRQH